MAHTRTRRLGMALIAAAFLVAPSATMAAEPGFAVTRVNGQTVIDGAVPEPIASDSLEVGGVVGLGSVAADAGSSLAVALGSGVALNGAVNRGTGPYTVEWSVNGVPAATTSTGSVELAADLLMEGVNEVAMSVTDAEGAGASDTVLLAASPPAEHTFVDEEGSVVVGVPDEELGLDGAVDQAGAELPFVVPGGISQLTATLEWPNAVNDLDLYLDDPSDAVDGDTSGATLANPEVIEVARPAGGDWMARVAAYLAVPDSYHVRVTGVGPSHDPLPVVDAGGPYEFGEGAEQRLAAVATAGEAEVASVAWDLDGDAVFESAGEAVIAALGPGAHRVSVKVTDAAGFEVIDVADVTVSGEPDGGPAAAAEATTLYLRRLACGGEAEQGLRLSLNANGQDVHSDANGCTNLTYPAAAVFSAAGIPIGDDYPYEEPATEFHVVEGRVGGTIYFGAQGASPATEIEVTVTGVSDGGAVTIGSQRTSGVVVDAVGLLGPRGIDLDFPVEHVGSVTALNLRLDVHNAQGFIWVELEDSHSHIEVPEATGSTAAATPEESRVEVQVVPVDGPPDPAAWVAAGGSDDADLDWSATVDIAELGEGAHDLVARMVLGGAQLGLDRVRFTAGAAEVSAGGAGADPPAEPATPGPSGGSGSAGGLPVTGAGALAVLGAVLLAGGVVLRAMDDRRHRQRAR